MTLIHNNKCGVITNAELNNLKSLESINNLDKRKTLIASIEGDGYPSIFKNGDIIEIDLNAKPKTGDYVVVAYQDVGITKDNYNGGFKRELFVTVTIGKYEYIGIKGLNKYHVYNLDPDNTTARLISNIDIVQNKIVGVISGHCTPDTYTKLNKLKPWNE